ncbi:TatD DNase [Blomia tropicalis]|nr:TatD DNase [Blomia tropicalis]
MALHFNNHILPRKTIYIMIRKKLIDIGANLTDPMFQGIYNGKQSHVPDLKIVIQRAIQNGLDKIIITGGNLDDSRKALELANTDPIFWSKDNPKKVVAIGEFGLDYDRLNFCPKDVQLRNFNLQFDLAEKTKLPLFLHCRNAASDLLDILNKNRDRFSTGVVHSFDGTYEEAKSFLDLGLYIGLNGCSLRSSENLDVVAKLPIDRLMIETDSPWCEIRASHASAKHVRTRFDSVKKEKWTEIKQVKSRNEPSNIVQVLEVIINIMKTQMEHEDLEKFISDSIYNNTMKVFFPDKSN